MIYPSIDKLLNQVGSKYLLVNVVSRRSKEMTERNHYQMKENEYVSKIRELIKDNPILQGNLIICGLLQKSQYYKLLKGASFFFHGGLIDNGNMATLDAAMFHVPTVSSRYPAMV